MTASFPLARAPPCPAPPLPRRVCVKEAQREGQTQLMQGELNRDW
jgi:hypothetical protein